MDVEDGADVGVAGVGAADALRVGDHGLELGADDVFGVGEQDGVVVAFGHLASVGAGELGGWGEQDFRLGEDGLDEVGRFELGLVGCLSEFLGAEVGFVGLSGDLAGLGFDSFELPGCGLWAEGEATGVEGVEAAGDLAGDFDVGGLILADGDEGGLVGEDIGGLEEGIAEEAVGGKIFLFELLLLILVGGNALKPGDRGDHAEEGVQLKVSGDVGLDEDGAEVGVESGGEEVEGDLADVVFEGGGVGVVGGEGVVVGDEEVTLVLVLELDPVVEGSHVVTEVESSGGAHAGEDAGARGDGVLISHCGQVEMIRETGALQMEEERVEGALKGIEEDTEDDAAKEEHDDQHAEHADAVVDL